MFTLTLFNSVLISLLLTFLLLPFRWHLYSLGHIGYMHMAQHLPISFFWGVTYASHMPPMYDQVGFISRLSKSRFG